MKRQEKYAMALVSFLIMTPEIFAAKSDMAVTKRVAPSIQPKSITAKELEKIRSAKVRALGVKTVLPVALDALDTEQNREKSPTVNTGNDMAMFVSEKHLNKIKEKKQRIVAKTGVSKKGLKSKSKENEVIVRIKQNEEDQLIRELQVNRDFIIQKTYKLKTPREKKVFLHIRSKRLSTEQLIEKMKKYHAVESVSPNYIYQPDSTPNDTGSHYQWGFNNTGQGFPPYHWLTGTDDADIDAPEAWDIRTDSSSVIAAVIDTGVDYNNEDLTDNVWINTGETPNNGIDDDENGFVDDYYGVNTASDKNAQAEGDPMDVDGHGTHVAGTVGAVGDNSKGVTGVNWAVKVMALNAYTPGEGFYSDDLLEAIEYILDKKDKGENIVVVNASYGGTDGEQGDTMADAIQSLGDSGIIFAAAAGNDGTDNDETPHYPSSYDEENIIAVANTDYNDNYAYSSNYGVTSVDISAPGTYILSTKWSGNGIVPHEVDEQWYQSQESSWSHGGTNDNWELIKKDMVYFTGDNDCWSDSSGDYSAKTDAYLDSPVFDLSNPVGSSLYVFFYITGNISDQDDYLSVEYWNSDTDSWDPQFTITGDLSSGVYKIEEPIDSAYYTSDFRVRFRMVSDSDGDVSDGYYIDDLSVGSSSYRVIGGTSMATPHVTGTVALLAAEFPNEDITVKKDRVLAGADGLSTTGKTVTDGRLNIYNALQNPALVSIAPQYGMTADDTFTLDGHSFGNESGKIEFVDGDGNSVESTVVSWADETISATIPAGYPGKHIRVTRSVDSKSQFIDGSRWLQESTIPARIDSAASIAYNGKIYLFGGQTDFSIDSTVYIYDSSTGNWSTGISMPTPRVYTTASLVGNKVYVTGGYSSDERAVKNSVEVYDIDTDSWSSVAPLPVPLAFSATSVIGSTVYVSGGTTDGRTAEDSVYAYDTDNDTWSTVAPMPAPKSGHGMISYNGKLYVMGGSDWDYTVGSDYARSEEMWIYDPNSDVWSSGTSMPSGSGTVRFGYALGTENGDDVIKISGGTRDAWWWSGKKQSVLTYNFTTDEWYAVNEGLDELLNGKFGTTSSYLDGVGFFSIGGFDDTESASMNELEKLK